MDILVNKEKLEQDMLQQELQMLLERYRRELSADEIELRMDEINEDAKQNAIERLILIQQARREVTEFDESEIDRQFESLIDKYGGRSKVEEHFRDQPGVKEKIRARIVDGVKLEQYFETLCADVETPSEEECRDYYGANKPKFQYPEMLRASHIVRQPQQGQTSAQLIAMMMNLREELVKGASFEDVANSQSQCDDDGGDLGWFPRGQMVPEFENVVFNMQPGDISDVFQTHFGFHIVKLFNRKEAGVREFEDVRYEIENMILEDRKNERIGQVVDKLRVDTIIGEVENQDPVERN